MSELTIKNTSDQNIEVSDSNIKLSPGEKADIPPISLIDIAKSEFTRLVGMARKYQEKINTAKTGAKRNYYKKKLKKNNVEAMQMLVAIEKLEAKEGDTSGRNNGSEDVILTREEQNS